MYELVLFYVWGEKLNLDVIVSGMVAEFSQYISTVVLECGMQAYKCDLCRKDFSQKSNLVKHIENIHFPDTYIHSCVYCSATFGKKNQLYKHVYRHHKKENQMYASW